MHIKADDPRRKRLWQTREAEEPHKNQNAPDQRKDHHRQLGRFHERALDLFPFRPPQDREAEHDRSTQSTGFCRRGPAPVDGRDDDENDDKDRQNAGQRLHPFAPGEATNRRGIIPPDHGPDNNDTRIDQRRNDTGKEPREQQLAHRLLNDNRVNHDDRRWGDQRCKRPTCRNHACRQTTVIPVAQHFRNRDAREYGRGRCRGAGHSGEPGRRKHRRHGQPTRHPANPFARRIEQRARHSGMVGQKADKDKHRQNAQRVCRRLRMRNRANDTRGRAPPQQFNQPKQADNRSGKNHPDADKDQQQQKAKRDQPNRKRAFEPNTKDHDLPAPSSPMIS